MELGNIVFGNSHGEYPVPREWEGEFLPLVWAIADGFENDTFWVFPYWWGTCECGWDMFDNGHEALCNLQHRDDCCQKEWSRIYNGWASHTERLVEVKKVFKRLGWSTGGDTWWRGYASRCSCDYDSRYDDILIEYQEDFGRIGHRPDCPLVRDNFHYKPTGFGVQWYKYPLRDAYMSQEVTRDEFREIVQDCVRSLGEK